LIQINRTRVGDTAPPQHTLAQVFGLDQADLLLRRVDLTRRV